MWHVTVFLLHFRKHNERLGWSDDEERQLGAEKEKKIHRARWSDRQSSDKKKKREKKQEKKSCLIFYSLCIPATHQPSSPPSVPYFYLSASLNYTQCLHCGSTAATYCPTCCSLYSVWGISWWWKERKWERERWVVHVCRWWGSWHAPHCSFVRCKTRTPPWNYAEGRSDKANFFLSFCPLHSASPHPPFCAICK